MKPHQDTCYVRKSQSTDLGWSCVWSLILIIVTGTVSLGFALMRFGGLQPGQTSDTSRNLADVIVSGSQASQDRGTRKLSETRPAPQMVPQAMDHPAAAPGFFFDIGAISSAVRGSTRATLLEKKGWNGVCVVPFPGDFGSRTCQVVAVPVSGTSGKKVTVQDCSQRPANSIASLIKTFKQEETCPEVEANTVGIADLLSLSAAPPVIDYIALDTQGSEFEILENFPFNDFCARSWTVKHNYDPEIMPKIRQILEMNHGCRVREGAGEYWARCICERKDNHGPQDEIGKPKLERQAPDSVVAMHPDGQQAMFNGH